MDLGTWPPDGDQRTAPSNPSPRDNRPLVLVVDDEESYRQALASGLHREGFAVECAGDGHEALRLFHRVHPDLVLLDVMLPDLSGIELCQQMRALKPVPIIMVTARDSEVDVVLGLELGASDYVPKPFRLRELVARMRAVLRRGVAVAEHHEEVLHVGPVRLDAGRREVTVHECRSSSPARSSTSCPSSCRTAARWSPATGASTASGGTRS
jgi:DNA-binding response OmpR family regulator